MNRRGAITRGAAIAIAIIVAVLVIGLAVYMSYFRAPAPKRPMKLVIARSDDADLLDPQRTVMGASWQVFLCIFDTYFVFDENMNLQPHLVESYEISPDGLVYTFHLRKGIKFHCGHPFDAYAVKYSIERCLSPELASPQAADIEMIDHVEVVDDYTVKIYLKKPYPFLLQLFTSAYHAPVCPNCTQVWGEKYGVDHVCGTGPFKFAEWVRDDYIRLVRNEEYNWAPPFTGWPGPPKIDEIIFKVIPEDTVRISELLTGGVDIVIGVPPHMVEELEKNPNVEVLVAPGHAVRFIGFNTARPPFNDTRVRLAVAYAIDREAIVKTVLHGLEQPGYSPLPPTHGPWYNSLEDLAPKYDPEKAAELLEEAGWKLGPDGWRYKNGKKLEIVCVQAAAYETYTKIAVVVQEQLKKIGIDMKIEELDTESWQAALSSGEFDMTIIGYGWHLPDILVWLFADYQIPWPNFGRVNDTYLQDLLERGRSTADLNESIRLYHEAQKYIIVDKAYWVVISYPQNIQAVGKWVKNYELPPLFNSWVYLDVEVVEEEKP